MDRYTAEMMAYEKFADARQVAARVRVAVEVDRARREAQHLTRSPLAGLLWTLAGVFGHGRQVRETTVSAGHAQ